MSVPRSEQHALQDHLSVYPLDTCAVVTHSVILVLLVVTKRCHPMHHHTPREQFWQELTLPTSTAWARCSASLPTDFAEGKQFYSPEAAHGYTKDCLKQPRQEQERTAQTVWMVSCHFVLL